MSLFSRPNEFDESDELIENFRINISNDIIPDILNYLSLHDFLKIQTKTYDKRINILVEERLSEFKKLNLMDFPDLHKITEKCDIIHYHSLRTRRDILTTEELKEVILNNEDLNIYNKIESSYTRKIYNIHLIKYNDDGEQINKQIVYNGHIDDIELSIYDFLIRYVYLIEGTRCTIISTSLNL